MSTRSNSVAAKIRKYLKLRDRAKQMYEHADNLYREIVPEMERRNKPIRISRSGQAAVLVDLMEPPKYKAFRAHGIPRYDIKVVDA